MGSGVNSKALLNASWKSWTSPLEIRPTERDWSPFSLTNTAETKKLQWPPLWQPTTKLITTPGRRRRQHHVTNTTNNKQTNKRTKQKWNTKIKEEVISFGPRGRGIGGQIDPQNPNGSDCGKTSQTNPSAENKSNTIEECWRYSKYTQLTMDKKKPRVI